VQRWQQRRSLLRKIQQNKRFSFIFFCWMCAGAVVFLNSFFCFYDEKMRTKDDSSFGGCGGDKEYTIHKNEQMQNIFPAAVGDRFKNNAGVCFG
jgi:hypothetical protein